jgi:hypothetical protein
MRQGSLHRWLAVLFLLFASTDISADVVSPQACCEELDGLASAYTLNISAQAQDFDGVAKIDVKDSSTPEQPSTPPPLEEECFCCCSHIIPSVHFEVAELDVEPLMSGVANFILPIPPPQSMYHPPRLS